MVIARSYGSKGTVFNPRSGLIKMNQSSSYDDGKTGGSLGLTRKRLLGEQRNHRKYEGRYHNFETYFKR